VKGVLKAGPLADQFDELIGRVTRSYAAAQLSAPDTGEARIAAELGAVRLWAQTRR
jgi:hypothetical protein